MRFHRCSDGSFTAEPGPSSALKTELSRLGWRLGKKRPQRRLRIRSAPWAPLQSTSLWVKFACSPQHGLINYLPSPADHSIMPMLTPVQLDEDSRLDRVRSLPKKSKRNLMQILSLHVAPPSKGATTGRSPINGAVRRESISVTAFELAPRLPIICRHAISKRLSRKC